MDDPAGAIALFLLQKGKYPIQIVQHKLLGILAVQRPEKGLTFTVNRLLGTDSDGFAGRCCDFGRITSADITLLQHPHGQQPEIELCR